MFFIYYFLTDGETALIQIQRPGMSLTGNGKYTCSFYLAEQLGNSFY